jgi:PAS domain S-box-containing protein
MSEAVVFLDPDNRIAMTNPAFSELTGYSFQEVRGLTPEFLYSGKRTLRKLLRKRYDKKGNPVQPVLEIHFRLKDGRTIPTETIGAYVYGMDGEVTGFLTVTRDITQRRKAEKEKEILGEKLRQSYKMEAIGTLAGGIAHDFNNILGIIFINTDMALEDIPDGNPARKNVERIVNASRRARDLVRQILAYSRQDENKLIPLMPGALIKESLQLLRSSTPATVTIVKNVDDDYRTIMMEPVQVQQMLMNLFANALRAMHDKGTIEVSGKTVELDEADIAHQKGLLPGPYFKLSVRDTGAGMEQEILERIFDPFFTAGETRNCTKKGLSNVMTIVKNHGGMITVVSAPDKGTTFHIFFPVVEPEYDMGNGREAVPGNERILLVDDEDMLIEMTSMYLQRHGYGVVEKKSSLDALEAFRLQPGAFDIVVTDQTMPDMTGSELAVELLKIRPDLPIILFSGFSKKMSREEIEKLGIREFLYKPFDGRTLAQAIRRVLDERAES